ncbi:MAG: pilus assembly protein PilP [Dissulfurispiraceae bacterium]
MRCRLLIAIVFIGISCLTCGSGFAGAYAAEPPLASAPATVPSAAVSESTQTSGAYEYSGFDRRDPFAPLVSKREGAKGVSPLESYDVTEMKIIAVLWDKKKHFAVISLPDGKSYNVTDGDKVGSHGGVITKITKDTVVIRERIRDASGVMSPRDTVLRLRGEEEE